MACFSLPLPLFQPGLFSLFLFLLPSSIRAREDYGERHGAAVLRFRGKPLLRLKWGKLDIEWGDCR